MDSRPIQELLPLPCPRNLTELRRFIRLSSYYHRLDPNFSKIASLFALICKDIEFNRLYAKLIYANNRLTAKLILKDIAASTKRLCTAFVYNSQGSNGVQNIISKLFKHYKLLTKGRTLC